MYLSPSRELVVETPNTSHTAPSSSPVSPLPSQSNLQHPQVIDRRTHEFSSASGHSTHCGVYTQMHQDTNSRRWPKSARDNIGHGVADLLVHRSDRTRQADVSQETSQVASRRNEGGCRAGHLFACGPVNPITNWKTMKQNGTMAKARQN